MEAVVDGGGGQNAYVPGYRIGGKTGTSQKVSEMLDTGKKRLYVASFCGVAPIDNPEIAMLFLLDEPQGVNYYGGTISAPPGGQILSEILPYLGYEPQYSEEELKTLAKSVPNVIGKTVATAKNLVTAEGLTYKVIGNGEEVKKQLPENGSMILDGGVVLLYTDESVEDEKTTVIHVNLNMDKEKYVDTFEVNTFSFDMLVNKYRNLSSSFEPDDLIVIPKEYTNNEEFRANKTAVNALIQMVKSAKLDGLEIVVNSAYRSYDDQVEIAEFYRKWYGDNYVNNYVAKPGFSEHQTGLAFDIGCTSEKVFADSNEYKWMQENAYKYGFVMRFYKKCEVITGFKSEPWHYRYVGKEIAKYIYENNITYEEYYVEFLM